MQTWVSRALSGAAWAVGLLAVWPALDAAALPLRFATEVRFLDEAPTAEGIAVSNWIGAPFDAGNVGGSNRNMSGGSGNGAANDKATCVGAGFPTQGQTFRTGASAAGYVVKSITVRVAGYRDNRARGEDQTVWHLSPTDGPLRVRVIEVLPDNGYRLLSHQHVMIGQTPADAPPASIGRKESKADSGEPDIGQSANGPGTYLVFELGYPVHLKPNTTYGFDLVPGSGCANRFEWLGIGQDLYRSGAAYSWNWGDEKITTHRGDRVFMVDMQEQAARAFIHPGALHTRQDLDRMKRMVEQGTEPWKASWDKLLTSPEAQLGWPAHPVEKVIRGVPGNNYTRSQRDAAAVYQMALRYHITGDTAYADKAVSILNAWAVKLKGLGGNSNVSLGAGIVGMQFAMAAELLSTYPGWAPDDAQRFKDMMMRVFYPANDDFLWRHHGTRRLGPGNTHYRLNWDTCNMASMLAIGVLCDNPAVYEQALDYFKHGLGNGRIERAVWYIHPDGAGQTEEAGRDQPHNAIAMDFLTRMAQVAWNQGDDLFSYDNCRLLRGLEYNARYNLGQDVPYAPHRNSSLKYTEATVSPHGRGSLAPTYELVYNHYVRRLGMAAPWSEAAARRARPEFGPRDYGGHPSHFDWFGYGSLTYTLPDPPEGAPGIAEPIAPSGLRAQWSADTVTLCWWGSAGATGYEVQRAESPDGPFSLVATTAPEDTFWADDDLTPGQVYFYRVQAQGVDLTSEPLRVQQKLVAHYGFEGDVEPLAASRDLATTTDSVKPQAAQTYGRPAYASGRVGEYALTFDGVDDFVELPTAIAEHQDLTIACWVYPRKSSAWQRVFDFGNEIEQCMFLTPNDGRDRLRFVITTTRSQDQTGELSADALPLNRWTHVAVTLRGDTGRLYVDGQLVDEQTITLDPLFAQTHCYLGRSMWPDPLFSGMLDELRIYNHALTQQQVGELTR